MNTRRRTPEGGWETEEARREREARRARNRDLFAWYCMGREHCRLGIEARPPVYAGEEHRKAYLDGYEAGERALAEELEEMGAVHRS
jgi:hypothetical protein